MEKLSVKMLVLSLNYYHLNEQSLSALQKARFSYDSITVQNLKLKLGFLINQIAIIQKCNSVMFVVEIPLNVSSTHVKNRILDLWDKISNGGIFNLLENIKIYKNINAIKYLSECSVGLHSVVLGDSQVFSQIYIPIEKSSKQFKASPVFKILCYGLKEILSKIKKETDFQSGYTSLERLACDEVLKVFKRKAIYAVIGLGSSGKLLVKILSLEKNIPLIVSNRTISISKDISKKYKNVEYSIFRNLSFLSQISGIIIALDNNKETIKYANKLIEILDKKKDLCKIIIDITSPSILDQKRIRKLNVKYFNIEYLSKKAKETINKRNADKNRVKQIINNYIPQLITKLNNSIYKMRIDYQRTKINAIKLSKNKFDILKIRNVMMLTIREYLNKQSYIEIHTPSIVGISTDPPKIDHGTVFEVSWPGGGAFLRQSNQLYKQIVVISGQPKVFEIGPSWRVEAKRSQRHLEETIILDIEQSHPNNLKAIYKLVYRIILELDHALINSSIVKKLPKSILPDESNIPILEYKDAISLLNKNGFNISYGQDLGIPGEDKLARIVKKDCNSDIIIVVHYPDTIKKFYTLQNDDGTTETFDIILFGWEVVSGALRETRIDVIKRQMMISGLNPLIYGFYLSVMKDAPPHGGFGMGLDRVVAKLLRLETIKEAVIFPRTIEKLIP